MMANNPAAERGLKLLEKCTLFGALEHAHPATLSPAMRSARSTSTAIVPGVSLRRPVRLALVRRGNMRKTISAMKD
jgi:hypothetical protein